MTEHNAEATDSRPATYEHIQTVQRVMGGVIRDLMHRAEIHDQSKLVSPEREAFDEFTPKLANSTYGSDEYRGFLKAMQPALEHHYFNNRHHPEHFAFVNAVEIQPDELTSGRAIRRMNLLDVLEMLCDWKAATLRHKDGDINRSIEINQKRFGYSDDFKQLLLNTVPTIEAALKAGAA